MNDRKGMAAVIDAFIFITIIGLIAAGMFAYSHLEDRSGDAKEMYDVFFGIELKTNDTFPDTDTQIVRMCDLVAAYMVTGQGSMKEYTEDVLRTIIPPVHDFIFTFEYDGIVMTMGEGGNRLISSYSSDITILGGKVMRASLSIY